MGKKYFLKVLPGIILLVILLFVWEKAQAITLSVTKLHIPFITNQGQTDEKIKFYAKTIGGTVFVTKEGEIVYSLHKVDDTRAVKGQVLKEELLGGLVNDVRGEGRSITKVSYFVGKDPSKWRSNIPTYELVNLGEVYRGIELKLKAYGNNVEKLFSIKPGAIPEDIKIKLKGIKGHKANESGGLEVETELGTVKFTKPVAYQEIDGKRINIEVAYNTPTPNPQSPTPDLAYGFKVGDYDRKRELIIDPLLASTYLGGSFNDYANSIAIDDSGNVYVTGTTTSTDLPTTPDAYDTSYNGLNDAFIAKFNKNLTTLLALTYLGGSNGESGNSIAINSSGNVYVTGSTLSTDFPITTGAYDSILNFKDAFISKFDSDLTDLLASTYLGGSSYESTTSIAIDSTGNVYVTGSTLSTDFPITTGAYDGTLNGSYDAFVSKFNKNLTTLLSSTYLGGSGADNPYSIALDADGNLFVAGETLSANFPTTSGAYDTSYNGLKDAFVSKLSGDLTTLLASTYLGGSSVDNPYSIALDADGNLFVVGETLSANFPTTSGAYDTTYGGSSDAFVSKFNKNLATLLASTFLGKVGNDSARSIAVDLCGFAYVAGYTGSSNFPTTPDTYDTTYNGLYDAFITLLKGDLTTLIASTFLGGTGNDAFNAGSCFDKCFFVDLAIDSLRNVYVAGETNSLDFPTTSGAYETSFNGFYDVFVSKLDLNPPAPQHILKVTKAGTGSGTVTSDPDHPGINCGSECTATFEACPQIALTASVVLGSGYYFVGWTACPKVNPDRTCTVIMNRYKTVGATFNTCTYSISPKSKSFPASGGKGSVSVTTQSGCPWTASSDTSWLNITYPSVPGSGTVKYSVDSNPSITSSRPGNITIYDASYIAVQTFPVTQARAIVHLIQPDGGEIVPSGSPYTIQWEASSEAVKFNLFLSMDNGLTWAPIANNVTTTSFDWTPKPLGNKRACLIRVIGYKASGAIAGSDRSDSTFTIEVVKLDAPSDPGVSMTSGDNYSITWTTYETKKLVVKTKLFLTRDGGVNWEPIIILTGNPGSYLWTVPPVTKTKSQCKVKVELRDSSGNALAADSSDNYFTIQHPP